MDNNENKVHLSRLKCFDCKNLSQINHSSRTTKVTMRTQNPKWTRSNRSSNLSGCETTWKVSWKTMLPVVSQFILRWIFEFQFHSNFYSNFISNSYITIIAPLCNSYFKLFINCNWNVLFCISKLQKSGFLRLILYWLLCAVCVLGFALGIHPHLGSPREQSRVEKSATTRSCCESDLDWPKWGVHCIL